MAVPRLPYRQFGCNSERTLVYFHGAPGAAQEAELLDTCARAHGVRILAWERSCVDSEVIGEDYDRRLAQEIVQHAHGKTVEILGFSLGAFVALQACRYMAEHVSMVHLVSAGAPLEAGDFLDAMAGQHVFRLARKFPFLFRLLSRWQGVLAQWAPDALFALLFASARGADLALTRDMAFRRIVKGAVRTCFVGNVPGYVRDVCAYVQPWNGSLSQMPFAVRIWHGSLDNWSPPAMAHALKAALPHCQPIEMLPGLSHYSSLQQAGDYICASQSVSP